MRAASKTSPLAKYSSAMLVTAHLYATMTSTRGNASPRATLSLYGSSAES